MLKNKTKKLLSLILIILILLISGVSIATDEAIMPISESSEGSGDTVETQEDTSEETEIDTSDWVNNDAYLFNNNIEVNKVVDGNVFAIGDTVKVTGEIGGDLFVIANKLVIDGAYVYNSVYALANEVELNGVVYDLYACASTIKIGDNGYVYRDLKSVSNVLELSGLVRRNAYVTANQINLASDGVVVNGNLNYTSISQVNVPDGAVTGSINYTKEEEQPTQSLQSIILSYVGDLARALIYGLIIILLTLWLAPKFTEKLSNTNGKKAAISFGVGILTCIVVPFVSLLLLVSVLGISVSLASLVMLALIVSITKAIVAMTVSGMITKKFKLQGKVKYILIALLVVAIIWAIGEIPFGIGLILKALIGMVGVGLVLTNIINKKEKKAKEEISEVKE